MYVDVKSDNKRKHIEKIINLTKKICKKSGIKK